MGGSQQAGVIGLGEALAAVPAGPATEMGEVDQPCPPGGMPAKWAVITLMVLARFVVTASMIH
jgi:hypothetical protein